MWITVELSEDQAKALLKLLREVPWQDLVTEKPSEHVRVAIGKAVGLHG